MRNKKYILSGFWYWQGKNSCRIKFNLINQILTTKSSIVVCPTVQINVEAANVHIEEKCIPNVFLKYLFVCLL